MKVPTQPEFNLGLVGHVDHGKTTLTEALSGEWTDRHSEEIKRGISIRLGYADTAIYQCPRCEPPICFSTQPTCPHCGSKTELQRALSFVDSPGHETLMATMLSGAALMDGALLLIAANEPCPQPQTSEHLMALEFSGVRNIIIVQNKIDLVTDEEAIENHRQIEEFVKGTVAEGAPIIPVSAHHDANLDVLLEAIQKYIPTPVHDASKPPRLYVARSFDVNKPGTRPAKLKGGVIGGSLIQGELRPGDEIEIKPGRKVESKQGTRWESLVTSVESLVAGGETVPFANRGGLVGIGTRLDPSLTKSDSLTGTMAGKPGTLPPILNALTVETFLMKRTVGAASEMEVAQIKGREPLMLNVGAATTVGIVTSARDNLCELTLKLPVVADPGDRVAISRRISNRWHLIGYGLVK